VNAGGGSFGVTLNHSPLDVWIFEEPIAYSSVNDFTIGSAGETFTFQGEVVTAPFSVPFEDVGTIRITAGNIVGEYTVEQDFVGGARERVVAPLAKGIEVEAYPDHDVDIPLTNALTAYDFTGVDLRDVDILEFSFVQGDNDHVTGRVNLNDFNYDADDGSLVNWWDNKGIRLRINTSDKSIGRISMRWLNGAMTVRRIRFIKVVDVEPNFQELTISDSTLVYNDWANNPLNIGDLTDPALKGSYLMLRWEAATYQFWQRLELPFTVGVQQVGQLGRNSSSWLIRAVVTAGAGLDVLRVAQSYPSATSGGSNLTAIHYHPIGAALPSTVAATALTENAETKIGTLGGADYFEAIWEYPMADHASVTTITQALSNFTGAIDKVVAFDGIVVNAAGLPYRNMSGNGSDDFDMSDFALDLATGTVSHTYEGNWSTYTARIVARYTKA